jgi:hypothetical protein
VIEVFKTNIKERSQSLEVIETMHQRFPLYKTTIDMEDRDKVLRVEALSIDHRDIIYLLSEKGFVCEVLPD